MRAATSSVRSAAAACIAERQPSDCISLPPTQMQLRQSHTAHEQLLRCQDRLARRLRHNAQARRRCNRFRRCRCSQRRRLGLCLTQLTSESVLAIPDRPASKLEPLRCIWLHRLLESRCHCAAFAATDAHATAPIAHSTRAAPSVPGPIGAAAAQRRLDADATISVHTGSSFGAIGPVLDSAHV